MSSQEITQTRGGDIASAISSPEMQREWAKVLPSFLTPERLARVALTQLRKNPRLCECTRDSLLAALMTCAEVGL